MDIGYIVSLIAINASGIIATIITSSLVKRFCKKQLQKKINEVSEAKEFSEIKDDLKSIKREILEMRGKLK